MKTLAFKTVLYLPAAWDEPFPDILKARLETVLGTLAKQFGGATVDSESRGAWMDDTGSTIIDPIWKITVWTEDRELTWFRKFAARIAREWEQTCILVEMGGNAYLVEGSDA